MRAPYLPASAHPGTTNDHAILYEGLLWSQTFPRFIGNNISKQSNPPSARQYADTSRSMGIKIHLYPARGAESVDLPGRYLYSNSCTDYHNLRTGKDAPLILIGGELNVMTKKTRTGHEGAFFLTKPA
jgi:hypothetical protein